MAPQVLRHCSVVDQLFFSTPNLLKMVVLQTNIFPGRPYAVELGSSLHMCRLGKISKEATRGSAAVKIWMLRASGWWSAGDRYMVKSGD